MEWREVQKKPVTVEWAGPFYLPDTVETLEGDFEVNEEYATHGYVIIRGVEGEKYPCRLDIFLDTYQVTEEDL